MASSIDLIYINFKGWYHGTHIAKAYRGFEVTPKGEVRRLEPDGRKSGLAQPTEPPAWAQAGCFRTG